MTNQSDPSAQPTRETPGGEEPVTDREEPARPSDAITVRAEDLERVEPNPIDVIRAASEESAGDELPVAGDFPYRQHPHRYCGSNSERQSVGDPGHCEACCSVGHVVAHPDLGCGDVGCYSTHGEKPAGETKPEHMLSIEDVPDEHGPRGVCSCGLWVDSDQHGSVPAIAWRWGKHWLRIVREAKPEAQR